MLCFPPPRPTPPQQSAVLGDVPAPTFKLRITAVRARRQDPQRVFKMPSLTRLPLWMLLLLFPFTKDALGSGVGMGVARGAGASLFFLQNPRRQLGM
jgi:hypothetical protein